MALSTLKQLLGRAVARLMRPGVRELAERVARLEELVRSIPGVEDAPDKYARELAFWRWLATTPDGAAAIGGPYVQTFHRWQRGRLGELSQWLGIADDEAFEDWCSRQSAVEIGSGPYPALAAAPPGGWRRAVAVDPLARAYVEEGLVPTAPPADRILFLQARGERVPLPSGMADLVILENALDHVADPGAVLAEARRLLSPDGLLWLLVDLSTHTDQMHPHCFDEPGARRLLVQSGFHIVRERTGDHKSHPKAYGEYRGLAGKARPAPGEAAPAARVRAQGAPVT